MQRQHSDVSSHARGSFDARGARDTSETFLGRGARSFSGALQRSLTHHSLSPANGRLQPTSLGWWVMTQPRIGADLPPAWHLTSATGPTSAGPIGGSLKRVFDIGVASLALFLLCPMLLMAALFIKLTMGGPVLLAHSRVGLNGKVFRCYKFRTMVNDAEEPLRRYLDQDPRNAREWQASKLARNPHVTALDQILRKAGIDRLPQLINVLRGDMSCVGPRPVIAAELQRYGAQAADYLKCRPGLTGLWQLSPNCPSYVNRVALDGLYTLNWSLLLDLAILVRTIPAILKFDQTA